MEPLKRLNLGCGNEILESYVNADIVPLEGVDVICDLSRFPWPFQDGEFDEVRGKDVLEHLPDTIKVMEEIHRITKVGGKVFLSVPYWNCWEAVTDPTHIRQFNELTFEFFDPASSRCQRRPYYSTARFSIVRQGYGIVPFKPDFTIPYISSYKVVYNSCLKKLLSLLANRFSNVIIGLELELKRV